MILAILVGTGVYFQRDRLVMPANLDLGLPAEIESRLGIDRDDTNQIAADLGQRGAEGADDGASEGVPSDGTSGAPNGDAAVGGTTSALSATEPPTADAVATEAPAATEIPVDTGGTGDDADGVVSTDEEDDPLVPEPDAPIEAVSTEEPEPEPTAVPTEEPEPTAVPTEEPEPTATAVPTQEPTPTAVPTQEPTPTAVPTATAVPTMEPTPTALPTQEPTPTVVPTMEPTPTALPTQEPTPTAVPTLEPTPTAEPTQEPTPTAVPTQEPTSTVAPTQSPLGSLPPSVDPETPPAQAVASGSFRFSVEGAAVGDSIPEIPEVTDVGTYGEWVVLSLYGRNWGESEQVFDMSQFTLLADGEDIPLDVGTSWVASQLGFMPAYGNTDAVLWAPGEGHPIALTFLVPPGTETLELRAGDQVIDLGTAIETADSLMQEDAPAEPEYIDARVVEVIDAETIIVEKNGARQEIRYLGIDVPTETDCFAQEATAVHSELVAGKTVRIERQATDVDAQGNWVRDVWVESDAGSGAFLLVSETLVADGAAEAHVSRPNVRFSGWLEAAQEAAQAEGAGLWGACETGIVTGVAPSPPVTSGPHPVERSRSSRTG